DGCMANDPPVSFGDPEPHSRWNLCDSLPIARNTTFERRKLTQFLVGDLRHARVPSGFVRADQLLGVVRGRRSDQELHGLGHSATSLPSWPAASLSASFEPVSCPCSSSCSCPCSPCSDLLVRRYDDAPVTSQASQ